MTPVPLVVVAAGAIVIEPVVVVTVTLFAPFAVRLASCVTVLAPVRLRLPPVEATARRLLSGKSSGDEDDLVDTLFEWLFHSTPMADERAEILTFVRQIKNRITTEGGNDADLQAWSQACHALFASSRFQILD
jgi:hypothetical protein